MSRRKFFVVGLLMVMVAGAPMLRGGSGKGTQYAILVAVSKYAKTADWKPLPYTIDEMGDFRAVLLDTGFAKENVEFLHDGQTDDKLRPTAANIVRKVTNMLDEIGENDTLLVALNGHGVQYKGDATGYFCPVNADLTDKKTLVPMDGKDGLYGLLEQCKAKRKLLIVNACRNDPTRDVSFARQKFDLVDRDEGEVPKGIAALFSCKPGQKSYYYPEEKMIKRSMFYHHLIEAWRGKYADGEKVTLDHVFDSVTRKTAADARRNYDEKKIPWPRRKYEGEWLLAKAVPDRPAPPDPKSDPKNPKPGDIATNSIGMKLAYIPPGKFQMGSPQGEKERESVAKGSELQHEVELTKGFYLGVYAVTQEEYETVMGKNPSWFCADSDGKDKVAGINTSRFPVESVNWEEAMEFCRKLSAKEGKAYRLPSEAEWEYACRAGTTTPFHYGETITTDQVNYDGNYPYGNGAKEVHRERTMKGGSLAPNAWGLFDMHGNVWQWCEDWYDKDYYNNSPRANPLNTKEGSARVLRGGCWNSFARDCRSAIRDRSEPSYRGSFVGFRVARSSVE